jgi:hypothetical protein
MLKHFGLIEGSVYKRIGQAVEKHIPHRRDGRLGP